MQKRHMHLMALLATSFLATACGGGGGGGGGTSSPEPAPVAPPLTPPVTPQPELFRITGTITASSSQAVDSDTNDSGTVARENDSVTSAQSIPNPITLGGYVNQPGTGAPGRSQVTGDTDD